MEGERERRNAARRAHDRRAPAPRELTVGDDPVLDALFARAYGDDWRPFDITRALYYRRRLTATGVHLVDTRTNQAPRWRAVGVELGRRGPRVCR